MNIPSREELKEFLELDEDGNLIYIKHFHQSKIGTIASKYSQSRDRCYIYLNNKKYRTDQLIYMFKYNIYAKYVYNIDGDRKNNSINNIINLKTLENQFDESQKMLKERISYNAKTGVVIWKAQKDMCNIGNPILGEDSHGYKIINIDGKCYKLHRIIWLYETGEFPNIVDHIDHNRNNNIFTNLLNGSKQDNEKNKTKQINNSSGYNGIYIVQRKYGEKYKAQITVNMKNIHLGCFDLIDDAIAARKDANVKYGFNENHGNDKVIETSWRLSREYRIWRARVIRRDIKCQVCENLKSRHVHHLNNAEDHPEERFDIDNGITLCSKCHMQFHCNFKNSYREKCTLKDWNNFKCLTKYFKTIFIDKDNNEQ